MKSIRSYGWIPDVPDRRDFQLVTHRSFGAMPQPDEVNLSLTSFSPPIYDQGYYNSCTGNSWVRMFRFVHRMLGLGDIDPSRLFPYNEARKMEKTLRLDCGAQIRDVIAVGRKLGVCLEPQFPYTKANLKRLPSTKALKTAKTHRTTGDYRINNLNEMLQCLADGYPFIFGFTVYYSFESQVMAKSGIMTMPLPGEGRVGAHAVTAEGYNKKTGMLLIANSWGVNWGQTGFFQMPFEYVDSTQNLWADAWTIRREAA